MSPKDPPRFYPRRSPRLAQYIVSARPLSLIHMQETYMYHAEFTQPGGDVSIITLHL